MLDDLPLESIPEVEPVPPPPGPTEAFRVACERLGLTSLTLVSLAERMVNADPELHPAEAIPALQQAGAADSLADVPGVAERVLEWSAQDEPFRRAVFGRFADALRARPLRPRALAEEVHQRAIRALHAGDTEQARVCLEELLPALAPERAVRVWEELFTALGSPEDLTDSVRLFLLPRVLPRDVLAGQVAGRVAARWLGVVPERLDELLALSIAPAYKLLAVTVCLDRRRDAVGQLAGVLASRPELLLDVLPRLEEPRARELFLGALPHLKPGRLLDDLMKRADRMPAGLLDLCLESLLSRGEGGLSWARRSWKELLRLVPKGKSVAALARQVLERPESEPDGDLLEFLTEAERAGVGQYLPEGDRQRLQDEVCVEMFLRKPTLDEEKLSALARALGRLPAGAVRHKSCERVAKAVIALLWKLPIDPQIGMERALALLGPVVSSGPTEFYRQMARDYRQRRDLLQNGLLLHAVLAVGLGETHRPDLADQGEPAEAFALVEVLRQKKAEEVLRYLDERTRTWAPAARTQWEAALTPGAKPPPKRPAAPKAAKAGAGKAPRRRLIGWSDVLVFLAVLLLVLGAAVVWNNLGPAQQAPPAARER
jgi:hypothetical protein